MVTVLLVIVNFLNANTLQDNVESFQGLPFNETGDIRWSREVIKRIDQVTANKKVIPNSLGTIEQRKEALKDYSEVGCKLNIKHDFQDGNMSVEHKNEFFIAKNIVQEKGFEKAPLKEYILDLIKLNFSLSPAEMPIASVKFYIYELNENGEPQSYQEKLDLKDLEPEINENYRVASCLSSILYEDCMTINFKFFSNSKDQVVAAISPSNLNKEFVTRSSEGSDIPSKGLTIVSATRTEEGVRILSQGKWEIDLNNTEWPLNMLSKAGGLELNPSDEMKDWICLNVEWQFKETTGLNKKRHSLEGWPMISLIKVLLETDPLSTFSWLENCLDWPSTDPLKQGLNSVLVDILDSIRAQILGELFKEGGISREDYDFLEDFDHSFRRRNQIGGNEYTNFFNVTRKKIKAYSDALNLIKKKPKDYTDQISLKLGPYLSKK